MRLQKSAIVVDTHEDVPEELEKQWNDLAVRNTVGHVDIPRWREGGVTAPFLAAYVNADYAKSGGSAKKALEFIDLIHRIVDAHPKDLVFTDSVAGHPPGQEGRQDRDPDRDRGRPRHRGLARRALLVLPAGRALHDADAHQHERLGRLLGQLLPLGLRPEDVRRPRRADRLRPRGRARDEPARDARRRLARLGEDDGRRRSRSRRRRSSPRTPRAGRSRTSRAT